MISTEWKNTTTKTNSLDYRQYIHKNSNRSVELHAGLQSYYFMEAAALKLGQGHAHKLTSMGENIRNVSVHINLRFSTVPMLNRNVLPTWSIKIGSGWCNSNNHSWYHINNAHSKVFRNLLLGRRGGGYKITVPAVCALKLTKALYILYILHICYVNILVYFILYIW